MENYWAEIGLTLSRNIPELIAWILGIVLAAIMLRRGAARPEKLLLAGCSLMLAHSLANPFIQAFIRFRVMERDIGAVETAQMVGWYSMPLMLVSIAGVACLAAAFWFRFWKRKEGKA
jgi:hypothetical protein